MDNKNTQENTAVKKRWSWLGFFFMPYYYAGYGALQKGIITAAVMGLFAGIQDERYITLMVISLIVGLSIAIYGGLKAKEELPVKQQKFNWVNVLIAVFVYGVAVVIGSLLLTTLGGTTPQCNDAEAKALVKQITMKELAKLGVNDARITLSNIRTSQYDDNVDKYTCNANITVDIGDGDPYSSDIMYTTQATDDGEDFYVEVFGL